MNIENQKKYAEYAMEEARWLDSIVRPFIPKWMQWLVEKNSKNIFGRLGHFFVDYFYIAHVLRITITRNQDTVVLGGKGFRPGVDHGYKIVAIRTKVSRKRKEIAEKKFNLDIIIKK